MNAEPHNLTRREALLNALKGTVAAAVRRRRSSSRLRRNLRAQAEATFVPENDYPFFGYEPDYTGMKPLLFLLLTTSALAADL